MAQPSHWWGEDLQIGAQGDLRVVRGTTEGQQRVLRRLMTATRELLFHLDYGAGVPQWVGQPMRLAEISSLIRSQLYLEAVVSDNPRPVVKLIPRNDGTLFASIKYEDAVTAETEVLTFEVS